MREEAMLKYGMNHAWPTPVWLANLLEDGVVGERLHSWLEKFASQPRFVSGSVSTVKYFARHDTTVFARPRHPQIARMKSILVSCADEYIESTVVNPLPEHDTHAAFFFVVQHPDNDVDKLLPHYHEGADVGIVYYLTTPSDGSGALSMFDPRGLISRGGRVFTKQMPGFDFSPRRGDLLLLPRYLLHSTSVNTDGVDRRVIAGIVKYEQPSGRGSRGRRKTLRQA